MVHENVEKIELAVDEETQQLDVEAAESLEEQAQEIAIEQGYFDGSIPSDISALPGLSPKRAFGPARAWHARLSPCLAGPPCKREGGPFQNN